MARTVSVDPPERWRQPLAKEIVDSFALYLVGDWRDMPRGLAVSAQRLTPLARAWWVAIGALSMIGGVLVTVWLSSINPTAAASGVIVMTGFTWLALASFGKAGVSVESIKSARDISTGMT